MKSGRPQIDKDRRINKDRRIKTRHEASSLEFTIHRTGFKRFLKKPIKVTCIDINRYGASIETTHRFRTNERIKIDFKGKYISQSHVSGFISSRVRKKGFYRLGITFSNFTSSKEYSRSIDNALARIETLYNEHYRNNR